MSSTAMNDLLGNAKMFQEMFVLPMVQAMETKLENMLQPVVDAQATTGKRMDMFEGRLTNQGAAISNLQANQTKAFIGWGVFASAGLGLIAIGWSKVKSWLHLN